MRFNLIKKLINIFCKKSLKFYPVCEKYQVNQ